MRKYFTPVPAVTGALHSQPQADATRSDWYFDANLAYQSTGFIDAPEIVPMGGECAVDTGALTIGVAYVNREALA